MPEEATGGAGTAAVKARKPRTVKEKPFVVQVRRDPQGVWEDLPLPAGRAPLIDATDAWRLVGSNPVYLCGKQYRVIQVCGDPKTKEEVVVRQEVLK